MAFTIFTENDKSRVIRYEAYSVKDSTTGFTLSETIQVLMESLERSGAALVPLVQADLDSLDTLDANINTERSSANNALVRADVLEWQPGARAAGMSAEFERIRARIARVLSQSAGEGASSGGLMRG